MKHHALLILMSLSVLGCVSTGKRAMSEDENTRMKNSSVTVVIKKSPEFRVFTPAAALLRSGVIGGALVALLDDGLSSTNIVEKYAIPDPALQTSEVIKQALEKTHNTRVVRATPADASTSGLATAYTLEFETEKWGLSYFPTETGLYGVNYEARARLYSNKGKTLIAEGKCNEKTELRDNVGSYKDIVNGQTVRLKQELARIAQNCMYAFRADMLLF